MTTNIALAPCDAQTSQKGEFDYNSFRRISSDMIDSFLIGFPSSIILYIGIKPVWNYF